MKYGDVKEDIKLAEQKRLPPLLGLSASVGEFLLARQQNAIAGELDGVSYNLKQLLEEVRQFRMILASMIEKKQGNRRK